MFKDRADAGKKLAKALAKYTDKSVLVLAIPRGGVAVGYEVATYLHAEFSFIITRKLPFPDNPEAGFGAIAEDGSMYTYQEAAYSIAPRDIDRIQKEQTAEIKRRIGVLRNGQRLPSLDERTVILVDDGIAMGSTMRASIALCKNRKAAKVIVASPTSSRTVAVALKAQADEVVILEKPPFFRAVADSYEHWYDVSDEEVLEIMEKWRAQYQT